MKKALDIIIRVTVCLPLTIVLFPCYAMCGVSKEESELLMEFLIEYWNAWTMDIIYGTYKYVNLTETVYSSWLGYKAKRG